MILKKVVTYIRISSLFLYDIYILEHDVVNQNTEKIESDDNNESNKEDENDDHQTVVDRRRKQKQINDDDSSDSENEHQRRTEGCTCND